jgi:hypothetical protein
MLDIEKFNGTNWATWSDNLENVLAIKEPKAWKMIKFGIPMWGRAA